MPGGRVKRTEQVQQGGPLHVFTAADAANPEAAAPFERKLFTLPRLFEERGPIIDGSQAWPGEGADAAAASGGGVPVPGVPGDAAVDPGEWPAL